jgi:hypothetical protein
MLSRAYSEYKPRLTLVGLLSFAPTAFDGYERAADWGRSEIARCRLEIHDLPCRPCRPGEWLQKQYVPLIAEKLDAYTSGDLSRLGQLMEKPLAKRRVRSISRRKIQEQAAQVCFLS